MATFVSLISYTRHGEVGINDTVQRADAFREAAKKVGAEVRDVFWTLGSYDGVLIFEAPDEATATTLLLSLGSQGNVRTETLRAFDGDQIRAILDRIP